MATLTSPDARRDGQDGRSCGDLKAAPGIPIATGAKRRKRLAASARRVVIVVALAISGSCHCELRRSARAAAAARMFIYPLSLAIIVHPDVLRLGRACPAHRLRLLRSYRSIIMIGLLADAHIVRLWGTGITSMPTSSRRVTAYQAVAATVRRRHRRHDSHIALQLKATLVARHHPHPSRRDHRH
jgi:hypothetical protein